MGCGGVSGNEGQDRRVPHRKGRRSDQGVDGQEERLEGGTVGQGARAWNAGCAMGTSARKGRHRGQGASRGTQGPGTTTTASGTRGTGVQQETT
eukprot:9682763-Alexandrium_andersonii.AAC.1